jgi:hypothetical protein
VTDEESPSQEAEYKPGRFDLSRSRDELHGKIIDKFGKAYGDIALRCLESRAFACECLSHDDPTRKFIALFAFTLLWRLDKIAIGQMSEIAQRSPLRELRYNALSALGSNTDRRIAKDLLRFLLKALEETEAKGDVETKTMCYHSIINQASVIYIMHESCIDFLEKYSRDFPNISFDFEVNKSFISRLKSVLGS